MVLEEHSPDHEGDVAAQQQRAFAPAQPLLSHAEGQEDDAVVWNGMTAARPVKADANATLEVSLPYQLFAGRLSALLFDLKPHLENRSGDAIIATVGAHVRDWLGLKEEPTEEQISVQVREDERQPGALMLALTVTPPPEILPAAIPVVMGYSVKGP